MSGSRGYTTPLWPVRYKPLPDESLSCWLVRLAHGHGMKVQTFCNLIFGNRLQVWNRDIDRLAPAWLLDALALHTGTPAEVVWGTTLRVFEGWLYPCFRTSGHLAWVQKLDRQLSRLEHVDATVPPHEHCFHARRLPANHCSG